MPVWRSLDAAVNTGWYSYIAFAVPWFSTHAKFNISIPTACPWPLQYATTGLYPRLYCAVPGSAWPIV